MTKRSLFASLLLISSALVSPAALAQDADPAGSGVESTPPADEPAP